MEVDVWSSAWGVNKGPAAPGNWSGSVIHPHFTRDKKPGWVTGAAWNQGHQFWYTLNLPLKSKTYILMTKFSFLLKKQDQRVSH